MSRREGHTCGVVHRQRAVCAQAGVCVRKRVDGPLVEEIARAPAASGSRQSPPWPGSLLSVPLLEQATGLLFSLVEGVQFLGEMDS